MATRQQVQPAEGREAALIAALSELVAAIDFEGPQGAISFNPGTPWELDALIHARTALAMARVA